MMLAVYKHRSLKSLLLSASDLEKLDKCFKMSKVGRFKDLKKMFKSSIRKMTFSMNNFGQIFIFFIGC